MMHKLIFKDDKKALKRLSKTQRSIDKFLKKHPGEMSKRNHSTLRKLLNKRAKDLSNATGMKIHSLFE